MRMTHASRSVLIGAIIAFSLNLSACSNSTVTTNTSTIAVTPTPSVACATLLPRSFPASAGTDFPDIPFPTGAVSAPSTSVSSGTGQYTITLFQACAQNSSASAVKSFYASQLISAGWTQDPTLPFNGSYQQACGDPYCWKKDPDPLSQRLIGLEKVSDAGNNLVTFQWRLFFPPPAGVCNAADFPTTGTFVKTNGGPTTDFQFPPFTYSVSLGGAAGMRPYLVCSAGDSTSILAFMKSSISKSNWKILSTSATNIFAQLPVSPPNGLCSTINIAVGPYAGYPGEWQYTGHVPVEPCT
jgi:hypothetical protein